MISLYYFFPPYNPITSIIMPACVKPFNGDAFQGDDTKPRIELSIHLSSPYDFFMAIGIAPIEISVMYLRDSIVLERLT